MTDSNDVDYGPGRSAPWSADAEAATLGSCLIDPEATDELAGLETDDFYLHKHRWIFDAIRALRAAGEPVDVLTVTDQLESQGQLDEAGGSAYLARLVNSVPTSLHAAAYGAIVREQAERRRLLALATQIAKAAYDESRPPAEVRADLLRQASAGARLGQGATHISGYLDKLYEDVRARVNDPRDVYGFVTGFLDWDAITAGLHPGEVTIIAGEPGSGKSMFLGQMAVQLAGWRPEPRADPPPSVGVVIYEMEMGGLQLVRRNLAAASGVTTRAMRSGRIQDQEWPMFVQAFNDLRNLPVYLSDATGWTTATLRADLTRLAAQTRGTPGEVRVAVIDYLNLLRDRAGKDEAERTAHISSEIHAIAKDLQVAVVTIQSLNKGGLDAGVPTLAHIGGSVKVSYDADVVAIITEHLPGGGAPSHQIRTITFRKIREDDTRKQLDLILDRRLPLFRDVEYRHVDLAEDSPDGGDPEPAAAPFSADSARRAAAARRGKTLNLDRKRRARQS